jgi:hypothetical protein
MYQLLSYPGTWYNLMDNSFVVSDVNATMSIPAGEFRIYGNKVASLAIADYEKKTIQLYILILHLIILP